MPPVAALPLKRIACWFGLALLLGALLTGGYLATRASDATSAMARGQYRLAAEYYAQAAANGDPAAATSLANLLYLGLGVEQDLPRAAALYQQAAGEGYSPAQLNLGHLYSQGFGVAPDSMRAFAWYRMSDIHGNPKAEYYLRQISLETTLTALQMSYIRDRWRTLDDLMAENL